MRSPTCLALILASLTAGCLDDTGVEDGADDAFMTDDAKADAFGVEDWSPDGQAVLRLVSTASARKLHESVGLSERVAKSIVAHRGTLEGRTYRDLAELDAAPYVGRAVFGRLLSYAADAKLFLTAIRVPLIVADADGGNKVALTSLNSKARAAGKPGFARYTFIDLETFYADKLADYNERLLEIGVDRELVRNVPNLAALKVGTLAPCYVGDPDEVGQLVSEQNYDLLSEMYRVRAWRSGSAKWTAADVDTRSFGFAWSRWIGSDDVALWYVYDDGVSIGDDADAQIDYLPPCR
jgi:hypothetical protein